MTDTARLGEIKLRHDEVEIELMDSVEAEQAHRDRAFLLAYLETVTKERDRALDNLSAHDGLLILHEQDFARVRQLETELSQALAERAAATAENIGYRDQINTLHRVCLEKSELVVANEKLTAQLATARADMREECAKVADAEYDESARLAMLHHSENNEGAMDRRNAAARSASRIAAAIRSLSPDRAGETR